jgi:hypothetical protein
MIAKSSGKTGDLLYGLPCAIAKGCDSLVLFRGEWGDPREVRDRLQPLIPDWKICCEPNRWPPECVDLDAFRKCPRLFQQHFTLSHAEMTGVDPAVYDKPWIEVDPYIAHHIIVSRSFNTRGSFPYERMCRDLGGDVGFVGTRREWDDFCRLFPACRAAFVDALNLRELAQVIAGADTFIGNPSAPLAIAEAMKHPRIYIERNTAADQIFADRGLSIGIAV